MNIINTKEKVPAVLKYFGFLLGQRGGGGWLDFRANLCEYFVTIHAQHKIRIYKNGVHIGLNSR